MRRKGSGLLANWKNYDWYYQSKKWISKNINNDEFDIVLSTYPSIPSHWIGKYVRDKNLAKKWVADFRDPMGYKELNSKNQYERKLNQQKRLVNSADLLIGVSRALVKSIEEMLTEKNIRKPVIFIPNGYDKDDYRVGYDETFLTNTKKRYISFAYTGGLYGGKRNIEVIFKVLYELIQERRIDINNLQFNYAGKEFDILKKQASKYKLENILKNHGYITRNESIKLQMSSDFIVVCTWNNVEYNGVIPGKIYESFLIKKPTIAIINGDSTGSEVADIINLTNIGIAFEEANEIKDYTKLKNYIEKQYSNYIENQAIAYEPLMSLIKGYEYINLTKQLEESLFELLD